MIEPLLTAGAVCGVTLVAGILRMQIGWSAGSTIRNGIFSFASRRAMSRRTNEAPFADRVRRVGGFSVIYVKRRSDSSNESCVGVAGAGVGIGGVAVGAAELICETAVVGFDGGEDCGW